MKVSTRINGRVTSINVRDSICALHYVICGERDKLVYDHILDTCHTIINTWDGTTGKGLSSYITDTMVLDLLEPEDLKLYNESLEELS